MMSVLLKIGKRERERETKTCREREENMSVAKIISLLICCLATLGLRRKQKENTDG